MPNVHVNGTDLYYEIHGEGEPIVLAHGMGGNHAIWYQQIPVLAQSYQVIVFDHRGFGNTRDEEGLGRNSFVSDLKGLLDHLKLEKVTLLGQSMGGGTCLCFTCRYPERVKALIVADSLHGLIEEGEVKAIMDKARAETADLGQIDRVLGKRVRDTNPAAVSLYSQLNSFNAVRRNNLRGTYECTYSTQQLVETGLPVMFIAGMEDILFPIEAIRLVSEQIPNAFLVELHQTGHSAFYESPTEFNDSVLSFLQMADVKPCRRPAHSNSPGYS